ncbi:hypothetical protein C7S18_18905 [Ahniella affigens]|uniref:Uncharacterized protein n=1 Tax=Ahniella affigens TaxID=2021234 RepID=A0A2P1PW80_9GAMM|nr:hypothetical protein C7S18_18905 [Ahniella affigens]
MRHLLGMYLMDERYETVTSFVSGYDCACEGGMLLGFREWLVLKLGKGGNLSWTALVLDLAFPKSRSPWTELNRGPDAHKVAVDTLFDLIDEFDQVVAQPDGLQKILLSHADCAKRGQLREETRGPVR